MANHPIFAPAFHGKVARVQQLLDEDVSLVNVLDAKGLTPLHVAASRGQDKVVQLLLDHGADVTGLPAEDKWTPLVFAAYRGHLEAVKVLVKNGAGVTAADGNPIHYSGQRKHKDICKFLTQQGAVDDLIDSSDEDIVQLFRGAYSYDSDAVEQVLGRREELIDYRDKNGRTPLHEACTNGDTKTVRVLLRFGADAEAKDNAGQSPVDRASSHRQHAVTKLLDKYLGGR